MSELMCPSRFYIGFVPSAGYHITPRVGILIGPLMTWAYGEIDRNPFMNFMSRDIDDSNTLFFGGKLSLRFRF
jgi:hypothetical protein